MEISNLTYPVPPSKGRRLAIGDVHGCFRSLMALLNTINATETDQLFFLGDMLDRGNYSEFVLDYLINGSRLYQNIFCVRGNHEQFVLNLKQELPEDKIKVFIAKNNLQFMFDNEANIKPQYFEFLNNLPYFLELDDYYLVHAGFNFDGDPFVDTVSMLTMRNFNPNPAQLNKKRCIIGHTPTDIKTILKSVKQKNAVINIDNGCVFGDKFPNRGNLVCIDLDTNQVYYQKNID